MSDRYASFARSGAGKALVKRLGLPDPPRLRRYREGAPLIEGPVLVAGSGRLADGLAEVLPNATVEVVSGARLGALIIDATGIVKIADLRELYEIGHACARSLIPSGRVIVLGAIPGGRDAAAPNEDGAATEEDETPAEAALRVAEAAAVAQALEGFTRSVGKEFGRGSTAQLIRVAAGAGVAEVRSTIEFLLSGKSAYVSGQVITVGAVEVPPAEDLTGKIALVTGAARGIGASIARTLARDGAHVVLLDVPSAGDALASVANEVHGSAYQLDLNSEGAASRLVDHLASRHGRVDIVVHNAGITRDKTLGKMSPEQWDQVLGVNLAAPVEITRALLGAALIPAGGRIIGVASIAGIAGNRGQTNYAASKAGIIGWVRALAPALAAQGITVNAVAPGFIETAMTAKMPMVTREAGRRMNSLAQGGLPIDVAETIAWFAAPGAAGVTGNVVRVCGQMLLGA